MIIKFIDKMNVEIVNYGQPIEQLEKELRWAIGNMFIPKIVNKPKTIDIWKIKNVKNLW